MGSLGVIVLDANFREYGVDITKDTIDLSQYAPHVTPPVFSDRYSQQSGKRPFNYVLMQQHDNGIRVVVRGLDKGDPELNEVCAIDIAR